MHSRRTKPHIIRVMLGTNIEAKHQISFNNGG